MKHLKYFENTNWNDVLHKATWSGGVTDINGKKVYDEYYIDLDKVKLAIENGADPDYCKTLSCAVRMSDFQTVKYLVQQGADINYQDNDCKWTPIMTAIGSKNDHPINLDMCIFLLDNDADPTIGNFQGITALDLLSHTKLRTATFGYPNVSKDEQTKMDIISKHIIDLILEKHPEKAPKYIDILTPEQKIKLAPYLDAHKFNI